MYTVRARRIRCAALLLATTAIAAPAVSSTVTGIVADANGVRPLQGAEIRIPALGLTTAADEQGRFRFTDLP